MIIKYEYIGDRVMVNVPDTDFWELRFVMFDSDGNETCNLCLTVKEKTFVLRDADFWCQGRSDLPCRAVEELYEDIVEAVAKTIEENPEVRFIDIDRIEEELIKKKYERLWIEKKYIAPDENGRW